MVQYLLKIAKESEICQTPIEKSTSSLQFYQEVRDSWTKNIETFYHLFGQPDSLPANADQFLSSLETSQLFHITNSRGKCPRGGRELPYKKYGVPSESPSEILKRKSSMYHDPFLWVWLRIFPHLRGTNSNPTLKLTLIIFNSNKDNCSCTNNKNQLTVNYLLSFFFQLKSLPLYGNPSTLPYLSMWISWLPVWDVPIQNETALSMSVEL